MKNHLALAFSLGLAACGSGGNGDVGSGVEQGNYKPTLGTLEGQVRLGANVNVPDAPIRVALLWTSNFTQSLGGFPEVVAQELGLSSTFPTNFRIDLTQPPPASTTITVGDYLDADTIKTLGVDPKLTYAQGHLIVYADTNNNGKLDLTESVTTPSPDTVIGSADDYAIYYVTAGKAGPATSSFGASNVGLFPIASGLSVVSGMTNTDPAPGDCDYLDDNGVVNLFACLNGPAGPTAVAAGASIPITLSNDPSLQNFACVTYPGSGDWSDVLANPALYCDSTSYVAGCSCQGTDCPLDLPPAGVKATCSDDNTSYVYKACKTDAQYCGAEVCHFGTGAIAPGATPPSGWPCPTK
jgi:hypothetical protein